MANSKKLNVSKSSITESLDELIEMKKNENSALKKIFESLKKPDNKKTNRNLI